jgi:hypothetical protein
MFGAHVDILSRDKAVVQRTKCIEARHLNSIFVPDEVGK